MTASSPSGMTKQGSGPMPEVFRSGDALPCEPATPTHLQLIGLPTWMINWSLEDRIAGNLDTLKSDQWCPSIKTMEIVTQSSQVPSGITGLVDSLPNLRSLSIATVGDPIDLQPLFTLYQNLTSRGLAVALDLVLSDDADAFASTAKAATSLYAVLQASEWLCQRGANVRWLIPLSSELVFRLEGIYSLARDTGVQPVLVDSAAAPTDTVALTDTVAPDDEPAARRPLTQDERLFAWDFINYRLLGEDRWLLSPTERRYYEELRDEFSDDSACRQKSQCKVVTLIAANEHAEDSWYLGLSDRPEIHFRPEPTADATRNVTDAALRNSEPISEVGGVVWAGLRGLAQWSTGQMAAAFRPGSRSASPRLDRAVLIGAYGGEHIGDTAILGGVLRRVHERYGVTRAVLMSQRARHTRHLVAMLDSPVEVEVDSYGHDEIRAAVPASDAVVYAGGPLMDLPKQLVLHLYTASLAHRLGKPFIVEGIGSGPFLRTPSAVVGRRLVKMASRLSVRTQADGNHSLVHGLNPEVGRDPAFDYLETRTVPLTRLTDTDRSWKERLVGGVTGRPLIGLNIRPIRHDYTETAAGQDPAVYTRAVESRFEQRLAAGMRQFHEQSDAQKKPCFVFFPMNAIQFGMSDLRSAFRLQRQLQDKVDFRVWQGDATLDGVVDLLRRMDVVITMRFHATIFALSQDRPVIGIDYRIGKRDKVAALLSDFGRSQHCARVDEMTADWLAAQLAELSNSPRRR